LQLQLTDEDGIVSTTTLVVEKQKAKKIGAIQPVALQQLKKSGGTVFSVEEVAIELSPDLFFPSAVFNDLRRKAFNSHLELRLSSYAVTTQLRSPNTYPWPTTAVNYADNITNKKAAEFYRHHGVQQVDPHILRAGDVKDCALMTTKYCIKAQLGMCPKSKIKNEPPAEPLTIADNTGNYALGFDCDKCEMTITKKGKP
jgi:putative protease